MRRLCHVQIRLMPIYNGKHRETWFTPLIPSPRVRTHDMHPVLQTTELLLEIVEYLEYDPRSLISIATTCQDFSAPACSVIWRNCDWFGPFVKLLPQDKYVLEDYDKISVSIRFVNWLSQAHGNKISPPSSSAISPTRTSPAYDTTRLS